MRKHDRVRVKKTGYYGTVSDMFKSIDKPIGVIIDNGTFCRFDYDELVEEKCKCN